MSVQEEEEWEAEDWEAEETEETTDVKDESTAYLDFLSQQASKFNAAVGEDEDDDELEEESLLETPLDSMEPYQLFKQTLESRFLPCPMRYLAANSSQRCTPHNHSSTPSYMACLGLKSNKLSNQPSSKRLKFSKHSNKPLLAMPPRPLRLTVEPRGLARGSRMASSVHQPIGEGFGGTYGETCAQSKLDSTKQSETCEGSIAIAHRVASFRILERSLAERFCCTSRSSKIPRAWRLRSR